MPLTLVTIPNALAARGAATPGLCTDACIIAAAGLCEGNVAQWDGSKPVISPVEAPLEVCAVTHVEAPKRAAPMRNWH